MWLFNRYMFFSRTSTTYPLVSRLTRQPRSRPSAFTRNVHVPAAVPSNLSYHGEREPHRHICEITTILFVATHQRALTSAPFHATSTSLLLCRPTFRTMVRREPHRHICEITIPHVPAAVPSNISYHGTCWHHARCWVLSHSPGRCHGANPWVRSHSDPGVI